MALFLRGNVWWMEYRTRKVRAVKSTGLRKSDRAKAEAVYTAWRLGFGAKPKRSVMESLLASIYGDERDAAAGIPISSVWNVYEDWRTAKARTLGRLTLQKRRSAVAAFVKWGRENGASEVSDVTVGAARRYVRTISPGRSNKTVRNIVSDLVTVWTALGQMTPGVFNPWRAALPDDDGTSQSLEAFSREQEEGVLAAAKACGHDWWLASMVSRWTGLRYGDVARLDWADVDLGKGVISVVPSKTKKHRVRVDVPISAQLRGALEAIPPDMRLGLLLPEHATAYRNGGLVGDASFRRVLERAGLGEGRYTFHSWRHTFRTRLAEAGVSTEVAMRLCGHTSAAMSAHYDHAEHIDELREAVAAISTPSGS